MILTVALAGTPLALMNGAFLSHDVIPKVILILAGAAWLLFLLPRWMPALNALRGRREGRLFLYLVAAQCTSLVLSTVFSSQPGLSLAGTVWRRFGLIEQSATLAIATAVACLAAARPLWIRHLLRAVILSGGVAALYGILQYFGVDPFLSADLYTFKFFGNVVRPPATLGHAIYFSAWLAPIALLAASSAGTETQKVWSRIHWSYVHGSVALMACLAILLAGSRGAVLAAIGGGLLLVLRRQSGKQMFSLRRSIGATLLLAIALALALSPAGDNFRLRLHQWRQDLGGPRAGVWRDTIGLIGIHPLLGAGPETFATEFRAIESAGLSRAYPDFYHETPHNAFLDAASAQGVPGLLILAGVFALGFPQLRRKGGAKPPPALQAALLAILIASLFASFTLVTSMYLWTLAGLAAALSGERQASQAKSSDARSGYAGFWRIPAVAAGALWLAAAIVLAVQDRAYEQLQDDVDDKNLSGAGTDYAVATGFSVGIPGYELWSSREFATLGRALGNSGNSAEGARAWSKAAEAASLAEKQGEERFSAAYQSTVLAVAAGDLTRAESKARETIALAPNWYKPHLMRGQILQAMGRTDEAAKEIGISRDLGWRGN